MRPRRRGTHRTLAALAAMLPLALAASTVAAPTAGAVPAETAAQAPAGKDKGDGKGEKGKGGKGTPSQPEISAREKKTIGADGLTFKDSDGKGSLDPYTRTGGSRPPTGRPTSRGA